MAKKKTRTRKSPASAASQAKARRAAIEARLRRAEASWEKARTELNALDDDTDRPEGEPEEPSPWETGWGDTLDYVRKHPASGLLTAALVGFAVGRITKW